MGLGFNIYRGWNVSPSGHALETKGQTNHTEATVKRWPSPQAFPHARISAVPKGVPE